MLHPGDIHPDAALSALLKDTISIGTKKVPVYADWERPTNKLADDFIVIYINGPIQGVGMDTPYAHGNLIVSLYCRLNDDGSVKNNRVTYILQQFDTAIEAVCTGGYHFEYEAQQFITPTTPNQTTGYSVTSLNIRWTTTSDIIKPTNNLNENGNSN